MAKSVFFESFWTVQNLNFGLFSQKFLLKIELRGIIGSDIFSVELSMIEWRILNTLLYY